MQKDQNTENRWGCLVASSHGLFWVLFYTKNLFFQHDGRRALETWNTVWLIVLKKRTILNDIQTKSEQIFAKSRPLFDTNWTNIWIKNLKKKLDEKFNKKHFNFSMMEIELLELEILYDLIFSISIQKVRSWMIFGQNLDKIFTKSGPILFDEIWRNIWRKKFKENWTNISTKIWTKIRTKIGINRFQKSKDNLQSHIFITHKTYFSAWWK